MISSLWKTATAAFLLAAAAGATAETSAYRSYTDRECPILDAPYRTLSALEFAYVFPADSDSPAWNDLSAAEVGAWVRIVNWETDSGGDLQVQLKWDSSTLTGFAEPGGASQTYTLLMGRIFLQWSQRFVRGYGLQVGAAPGLYTGFDDPGSDAFRCPAGLSLTKAFSPDFALFLGADVYPGFDLTVDPNVGVQYAPSDRVLLRLAYPESRVELSASSALRFVAGARLLNWPEYSLGSEDPRERMQVDEGRAFAGLEIDCTESTQIVLMGGYVFGRTYSFEAESEDVEMDSAPFVQLGLRGRW